MRLARAVPAWLVGGAAAVLVTTTLVGSWLVARLVDDARLDDYRMMERIVERTLSAAQNKALVAAEVVEAMPAVRTAFVARDREALHAQTRVMFEEQAQKYGVGQAQFVAPPGISFLRLHRPAAFGDDQTTYRPMLSEVHKTHSTRKGIVVGRGGPTMTAIVPVFDDAGGFQGTFEMGFELGPMLDRLKEAFDLEATLFLDEKLLRSVATDLGADALSLDNRVGPYIRLHATRPELAALYSDKDVTISRPAHFRREGAGTTWANQLVPLYDYANKQIGVVALASDYGADAATAKRTQLWLTLAAGLGVLVFAAAVVAYLRRGLLAPLASIEGRLRALSEGAAAEPVDWPAERHCDELRELRAAYQRLREEGGS